MRCLLIWLILGSLAGAQTVDYERTLRQIPIKAAAVRAEGKNSLAVQGSTVLLGDDKGNGIYRLPDLKPVYPTLPAGQACLGADGNQVCIYRQGALELYTAGHLTNRRKHLEPLWFGEVGGQWVVVTHRYVDVGRRRFPLKLGKLAQVFGVWLEKQELLLSTTDVEGSTYLRLRLKDGKFLPPVTERGDVSLRMVTPHFDLKGDYMHPGDVYTYLTVRSGQFQLSTHDYFPSSVNEGGGRVVYLLKLHNEHLFEKKDDLLEVLDPQAGQRWTWEGPSAAAGALSGDGKILVVLALGNVYVQELQP